MRIGMRDLGCFVSGGSLAPHVDKYDAGQHHTGQGAEAELTQSPEVHRAAMVRLIVAVRLSAHKWLKGITYSRVPRRPAKSVRCVRPAPHRVRAPTARCAIWRPSR